MGQTPGPSTSGSHEGVHCAHSGPPPTRSFQEKLLLIGKVCKPLHIGEFLCGCNLVSNVKIMHPYFTHLYSTTNILDILYS